MKSLLLNPFFYWLRWVLKKTIYEIKFKGKHLLIDYMVELKNCEFGNYNSVYKFSRLRNTTLGDFSYIARDSQVFNAKIGKYTCIGPNVSIGMGSHPSSVFVSIHPLYYSTLGQSSGKVIVEENLFEEFHETIIGHDVWIGNNVSIKSGIKIGNGSILASGSVITKDVEPYSIVGGVPAKPIKSRFNEEQIDFLEEFKWWDKDFDWIEKNKDFFINIDDFIKNNPIKS